MRGQRASQIARPAEVGQDEGRAGRKLGMQPSGRGQPIEARQVDVDDRDIRVVSQRLRNDIVPALDGGDYLHIGFQFDKCDKRTAYHGDIFGEQYPQRAHASHRSQVNLLVMPRTGNLLSARALFRAAQIVRTRQPIPAHEARRHYAPEVSRRAAH